MYIIALVQCYLLMASSIVTSDCNWAEWGQGFARVSGDNLPDGTKGLMCAHLNCDLQVLIQGASVDSRMGTTTINNGDFYMCSVVTDFSNVGRWSGTGAACDASTVNGAIGAWDVSQITNMASMFGSTQTFNADISTWDVSRVTTAYAMFQSTGKFNAEIGAWDVSQITNIGSMFNNALAFNQPIGNWDVSKVNVILDGE